MHGARLYYRIDTGITAHIDSAQCNTSLLKNPDSIDPSFKAVKNPACWSGIFSY
jgi:hypothetical protein